MVIARVFAIIVNCSGWKLDDGRYMTNLVAGVLFTCSKEYTLSSHTSPPTSLLPVILGSL